jgi:hypothetical protein
MISMNEAAPETKEAKRGGGWLSVVGLAVLALFGVRTISHASFWLRLAAGRAMAEQGIARSDAMTFTAAGHPWINTSWLYDRVLYGLWNVGGASLVILLHVAVAVAAFALLIRSARRLAGPSGTALALLGCAWLFSVRFVVSPVLVALLFTAIFVRVLSGAGKSWAPALLLPVQLVWANVHGSFILGPILFFLFALERWHGNRESQEKKALGWVSGMIPAALLVSLVNPYGVGVYTQTFRDWGLVVFAYVQEWVSPFSPQFEFAFFVKNIVTVTLLIGAIGLITEKRKLPFAETTLAVLGAFLVVRSLRHVEFFALLAFPFLALSVSAMGVYVEEKLRTKLGVRTAWWPGLGMVLTLLLALFSALVIVSNVFYGATGSASTPGLGMARGLFPDGAADILARPDFPAKAVNLVHDGGYLAWRLPGRKVFVDPRADLYGPEFFETLIRSLNGDAEALSAIEARWEPEAAILNGCAPGAGPLLRSLLDSGRWGLAYFDGTSALLVRATAANRAWLDNQDIQREGLRILEEERRAFQERIARCPCPSLSPRLIGAGVFFMAMNRFSEAEAVYGLLVRGAPAMVGAWYNLGLVRLQLGKFEQAVVSLKQACRRQPRDPRYWLQLSRACAGAGMPSEAEQAFEKARKLDPAMANRFRSGPAAATP